MNKQENPNLNRHEQGSLPEQSQPPIENNDADPGHETEQTLGSIETTSNQSIEAALDTSALIEKSNLQPKHKEQLRDMLKRSLKKMFRIFTFATALTGAAGVADYTLTRYKVEPKSSNGGEITYAHQDQGTTHIINVLAGKEKMTDADKKEIYIDYLVDALRELHKEGNYEGMSRGDFDNMSLDELDQAATEFMAVQQDSRKLIPELNAEAYDPELYKALWKLEQECGNPKVKFRLGSKKNFFSLYNTGRNFYNPYTNTVFLNVGDNEETVDNYVAELSHGKQFGENPVSSNLSAVKGILKAVKNGVFEEQTTPDQTETNQKYGSIDSNYETLYDEPGTLEYEAHKVIEPKLRAELETLTPTRVAKQKAVELRRAEIDKQIEDDIKQLNAERDKIIDDAQVAYMTQLWKSKDADHDKLREEFANTAHQIREDFQKKKDAVFKRYGVR